MSTSAPQVRCGDTVTSDIKLSSDLRCSGNGLVVKADGIALNLNGHSITGSGTGTGIVVVRQARVRVQNGRISNFDSAALFAESTGGEMVDLTISDNTGPYGLTAAESADFKLTNSRMRRNQVRVDTSPGLTVTGTEFTKAGLLVGSSSRAPAVSDSTFVDSTVLYSTNSNSGSVTGSTFIRSGLSMREADNVSVSGNSFNQGYVQVLNGCRDATISGNRFSNGDRAVFLQQAESSANLRVTGNRFTRNQIGLDASGTLTGVEAGLTISENTFTDNAVAGILLEATSQNSGYSTRLERNTLKSNGKRSGGRVDSAGRPINDGIHVNVPASSPVEITGNITRANADYGIEAVPGSVTDGGGNTSSGNPSGCLGVTCA